MSLGLAITKVARALEVTPMPLLRGFASGRALLEGRGLALSELANEAMQKSA